MANTNFLFPSVATTGLAASYPTGVNRWLPSPTGLRISGQMITADVSPGQSISDTILTNNYGFNIPNNSRVLGIEISGNAEVGQAGTAELDFDTLNIGFLNGTGLLNNTFLFVYSFPVVTDTNLLGFSYPAPFTTGNSFSNFNLTVSQINSTGFGLALQYENNSSHSVTKTIYLGRPAIRVWYADEVLNRPTSTLWKMGGSFEKK